MTSETIKAPRYITFPVRGAGEPFTPRTGQTIWPAPRTYSSPEHAQLANPAGCLYVGELVAPDALTLAKVQAEGGDVADYEGLDVVACADSFYPVTLREYRTAGVGCSAEGAYVLRDMGPRALHRWATHFRNDQCGGHHGGEYFSTFEAAAAGYLERVNKATR